MPWSSNDDLPKGVKGLPSEAQSFWRKIANSALEQYPNNETRALATAWSGLKRAGWSKNAEGDWKKDEVEKDSPTQSSVHVNRPLGEIEKQYIFDIKKSNDEKKIAFGWCVVSRDQFGQEVFDLQNDGVDPDDLEALAYKYVEFYRDSGELHINSGKAVLIESVVTTLEKQEVWNVPLHHMPVGWWVGFHILDDKVWQKVKDGTYKAFSIQGTSIREEVG